MRKSPPPPTARALRDATRALIVAHAALDDARRPCGTPLPMAHAWALLELKERGPLTIKELAAHLNIDRSNVSRLCARMEESGELRREVHAEDARARVVALTPKGARIADEVDQASATHFATVMERLEYYPAALLDALGALTSAMRTTGER